MAWPHMSLSHGHHFCTIFGLFVMFARDFFSQLGQEDDYQRVCTCLYDEDKASVKLDDGGNVRCEFYDGKVLSGKYAEYKIRDTYMP